MISSQPVEPDQSIGQGPVGIDQLTPHECRIVAMLADGLSYLEIAKRFGVTVNTIRNYIRSAYRKLDVHTKSEAVGKALRRRLIT